jgi:hypothetical protein
MAEFQGKLMQDPARPWDHLDSSHLDVNRPDELAYWTKELKIDEETLKDAARQVGPSITAIRLCLEKAQARP